MATYKKITEKDRRQIEEMRLAGAPARRIAQELGVARSTIYRELARGYAGEDEDGQPKYSAAVAQYVEQRSMARRGRKNTWAERQAANDGRL